LATLLGIDTGGTYTDAVLYDGEKGVLAKAKALTTKQDLAIGVGEALAAVLPADPSEVELVSLSTTLATNALVEGQGAAVGLILIGYPAKSLERGGLGASLRDDDAVAFVAGGHGADGEEQAPLDLAALRREALAMRERVSAFAVAGFFAVRNPSHELTARALLREIADLPVTCAHELSAGLDAPRRALTAVLNARLIPLIKHLIEAVSELMQRQAIVAPLMVVKGDGSLVSASVALAAPVETILSGPAASLVGARALATEGDVFVSDMGGTTTDIALLRDGRPVLSKDGATVGGFRTMVEAVAVHTLGLGGDSEVRAAALGQFTVGPRRAQPLSLLATSYPKAMQELERQAASGNPHDGDGRFVLRLRQLLPGQVLKPAEAEIWEALAAGPLPVAEAAANYVAKRALERLQDRGLVIVSAFTPSDAAHLLGRHSLWNRQAALLGARLLARQLDWDGTAEELAEAVSERVVLSAAEALVETALAEGGHPGLQRGALGGHLLTEALRAREADDSGLLRVALSLGRPLVAIGAPVASYYPAVAKRLGTRLVLPEHAEVCNAVGAVASGVSQRVCLTITQLADGRYRAHLPDGISDFIDLEAAATAARAAAHFRVAALARQAGASDPAIEVQRDDVQVADRNGRPTFVESAVTATAFGRPRLAEDRAPVDKRAQASH